MSESFYNTINLEARELSLAQIAAMTQDEKVLRFFIQQGFDGNCAPSAVRRRVFDNQVPVTSVRRAMTTLTNRGDLVKLNSMITGPYGKPEHLWSVSYKWKHQVPAPSQGELL